MHTSMFAYACMCADMFVYSRARNNRMLLRLVFIDVRFFFVLLTGNRLLYDL